MNIITTIAKKTKDLTNRPHTITMVVHVKALEKSCNKAAYKLVNLLNGKLGVAFRQSISCSRLATVATEEH